MLDRCWKCAENWKPFSQEIVYVKLKIYLGLLRRQETAGEAGMLSFFAVFACSKPCSMLNLWGMFA